MIARKPLALLLGLVALQTGCATNRVSDSNNFVHIALPAAVQIPNKQFSLADFSPAGDGKTDDTAAFAKAIAAVDAAGGGHLNVPAGQYLIGPIRLVSKLDLHLAAGAKILVRNDIDGYPTAPAPFYNNDLRYTDTITADFCHDVSITGRGTIDGQGQPWWKKYQKRKGNVPQPAQLFPHRPNLVVLSGCDRVLIGSVTILNSPNFHIIPQQCRDVTIHNVTITAPAGAPNTDGIDPSGQRIAITNCDISVGDDNVVFKPQIPASFPKDKFDSSKAACEDLLVANCKFGKGHGMSIGGQTTDGLKRLLVRDCIFDGTTAGIRLKADQGFGGLVEDCVYENITMKGVSTAILLTSYYPGMPRDPATMPAKSRDAKTPVWKNITIRNVTATGSLEAGGIIGLAEKPVDGVKLINVNVEARRPLRVVDAQNVVLERSAFTMKDGKPGVVATRASVKGIDVGEWTGAIEPLKPSGGPATTQSAD
ncbi:MAG: hypothetical protein JWM57_2197 [Phycisphaerales bacterium]|nr:hypothetical protein [Phycisphaerales bacterium]